MDKLDLTLDVGVLMSASGLGALHYRDSSLRLTKKMLAKPRYLLALDKQGTIRTQYNRKIKPDRFGQVWLREMGA